MRTLHDIPKGTFICTYVGNLYGGEEGNRVGKNFGDEYFADLDMIEVVENAKTVSEDEDSDEGINLNESSEAEESLKAKTPPTSKNPTRKSSRKKKSVKKPSIKAVAPKEKFVSVRKLFGSDEESYIMDAKRTGNIGRYLNHSCYPNVFVQNVFVDTHDLRFPWIAFFTTTFVRAGQELCWDYRWGINIAISFIEY